MTLGTVLDAYAGLEHWRQVRKLAVHAHVEWELRADSRSFANTDLDQLHFIARAA